MISHSIPGLEPRPERGVTHMYMYSMRGARLRTHLTTRRVARQAKSVGLNEPPFSGCGIDHIEEEEVVSDRV